ncbi:MAG TPA: DUF3987 domain-containing protein [Ktedonobacteraceae bacterium]
MTSRDLPQPRTHAEEADLRTARFYFRSMLQSDAHTDLVPQVGRWDDACQALHAVHKIGGCAAARKAFITLCKDDPTLLIVVSGAEDTLTSPFKSIDLKQVDSDAMFAAMFTHPPLPAPVAEPSPGPAPLDDTSPRLSIESSETPPDTLVPGDDAPSHSFSFKPLPRSVLVAEEPGASPWLDAYIEFSKQWSPRGYDGFHEAVGLWVLSTIAAHRVMLPIGDESYTPLLIVLVGRTGLFAKSTTAKIGRAVLKSAGLEWFLAPDDATPQKFISEMAGHIASNYDSMSPEAQRMVELQYCFAGQRGWFYDEFGQIISAIMKDGIMSDFRGILRRLDDCYDYYNRATISRGTDSVENPYLALLGSMTPDDLGKAAKSGSSLWGDGFLARFAFVTPPAGTSSLGRFPPGLRVIPDELSDALRVWHQRLGIPAFKATPILDKNGNPTDKKTFERGPLPEQHCIASTEIMNAYYTYGDVLTRLRAATNKNRDLDGNYARFASKALRIAMLLASLENDGHIEMRHWARGQAISERWRANLHELFAQTNTAPADDDEIMEDKILEIVERLKEASVREIKRYIRGIDITKLRMKVHELARAEMLEEIQTDKTTRYRLPLSETH